MTYLLGMGAEVDAEGPNGTTALMMAARGGHTEAVDLLLARGADANHRNQSGASALSWAERGGYGLIMRSLQQHGAK